MKSGVHPLLPYFRFTGTGAFCQLQAEAEVPFIVFRGVRLPNTSKVAFAVVGEEIDVVPTRVESAKFFERLVALLFCGNHRGAGSSTAPS
jgi:hypothetical protein